MHTTFDLPEIESMQKHDSALARGQCYTSPWPVLLTPQQRWRTHAMTLAPDTTLQPRRPMRVIELGGHEVIRADTVA